MRGLAVCACVWLGGCAAPAGGVTFDPCTLTVAADAQGSAVDAALALWTAVGVPIARGSAVPIRFVPGPSDDFGQYDDTTGTVYVNADLTDPRELPIVIAHELGHAVGLVHVAPATRASVMNPGNLSVVPTAADAAAIAAQWGACPAD